MVKYKEKPGEKKKKMGRIRDGSSHLSVTESVQKEL